MTICTTACGPNTSTVLTRPPCPCPPSDPGGGDAGVPTGALVHINFLTGTGDVGGGRSRNVVPIDTLLGHDPRVTEYNTAYFADAHTQYGYDPDTTGHQGQYPALIGPLLDALLSGKSIVIKFQSRGGALEDYSVYQGFRLKLYDGVGVGLNAVCYDGQSGIPDSLLGYAEFDSMNQNVYVDDVWQYSLEPGGINAIGFRFATLDKLECACNNVWSSSAPLVDSDNPAANPLVCASLACWGPVASISIFDTLSLADLQAKTAPVLD